MVTNYPQQLTAVRPESTGDFVLRTVTRLGQLPAEASMEISIEFSPTGTGTGMFQTADGYINVAAAGDAGFLPPLTS